MFTTYHRQRLISLIYKEPSKLRQKDKKLNRKIGKIHKQTILIHMHTIEKWNSNI